MQRIRPSLFLASVLLSAPTALGQGVPYELHSSSAFLEGCYEPCDCKLALFPDSSGLFELEFSHSTPDGFDHYDVRNVAWTIGMIGGPTSVTGSGVYSIGGNFALSQRLELDLSLGGDPLEHFDSGVVLGGYSFPVIDVEIAMNDFFCFDRVFDLNAAPLSIGPTYCSSAPNSVGPGATIAAVGSPVVATNDFGLVAQGAPAASFGLFFFGANPTQQPLGDGFLCATGSIQRLQPPLQTDPSGNRHRTIDLNAAPALGVLTPGSTWYFQFWYRDPSGGPSGFNLTNGVSVGFL